MLIFFNFQGKIYGRMHIPSYEYAFIHQKHSKQVLKVKVYNIATLDIKGYGQGLNRGMIKSARHWTGQTTLIKTEHIINLYGGLESFT